MKYYKHNETGEVYAYSQADIDTVEGIAEKELALAEAQAVLTALPNPTATGEPDTEQAAAEKAVADAQRTLDSVPPVFFAIRGNLAACKEMSAEEIEAHLNPPAVIVVPVKVSRAQGKAALVQAGLWESVKDYAASIEDPTQAALADIVLNDTTEWERSSPFLTAAAQSLGLSEEDIDNLFIQASGIHL